jgi:hypothetical protein
VNGAKQEMMFARAEVLSSFSGNLCEDLLPLQSAEDIERSKPFK